MSNAICYLCYRTAVMYLLIQFARPLSLSKAPRFINAATQNIHEGVVFGASGDTDLPSSFGLFSSPDGTLDEVEAIGRSCNSMLAVVRPEEKLL